MYFNWHNKRKTIEIGIGAGIDLCAWGLPLSITHYSGRYNIKMEVDDEGKCTFNKIESSGWFTYPCIRFLCFYLYIEFDRWYDETK